MFPTPQMIVTTKVVFFFFLISKQPGISCFLTITKCFQFPLACSCFSKFGLSLNSSKPPPRLPFVSVNAINVLSKKKKMAGVEGAQWDARKSQASGAGQDRAWPQRAGQTGHCRRRYWGGAFDFNLILSRYRSGGFPFIARQFFVFLFDFAVCFKSGFLRILKKSLKAKKWIIQWLSWRHHTTNETVMCF